MRGLDLLNEGDEGLIVIDPLTCEETGAAALGLYQAYHYPGKKRPIKAIIYIYPYINHFGCVRNFITGEDVEKNKVKILALEGFLEHAVLENIYTGIALSQRAAYMYGAVLAWGPTGQISVGLGQAVPIRNIKLIPPNISISRIGDTKTVNSVSIEVQILSFHPVYRMPGQFVEIHRL